VLYPTHFTCFLLINFPIYVVRKLRNIILQSFGRETNCPRSFNALEEKKHFPQIYPEFSPPRHGKWNALKVLECIKSAKFLLLIFSTELIPNKTT
jgi:hypothetical protein